jgi:hypothetical protein
VLAQFAFSPPVLTLCLSVHSFDFDKKMITAEVIVPEAHFTGQYQVKGKLVALPISGNGDLDATMCKCQHCEPA